MVDPVFSCFIKVSKLVIRGGDFLDLEKGQTFKILLDVHIACCTPLRKPDVTRLLPTLKMRWSEIVNDLLTTA